MVLGSTAFSRCDLQKADFREATGYRIDPSDNQMKGARFSFPDVIALLNGFGLVIESLRQYRIILSADTASEVRRLLNQKRR